MFVVARIEREREREREMYLRDEKDALLASRTPTTKETPPQKLEVGDCPPEDDDDDESPMRSKKTTTTFKAKKKKTTTTKGVVVRVLLLRHAKTGHNALGIIQGQLDTEVNLEGSTQIEQLRDTLLKGVKKTKNIRKIFTSDLRRCSETARGMMKTTGDETMKNATKIIETPKLRERHVGILQGCERKMAPIRFPEAWAVFCESRTRNDKGGKNDNEEKRRRLKCLGEGGESVDDVLVRVRECIEDAVRSVLDEDEEGEEESGDPTIAVVTHAGVLLLLREYLVDEDLSGEKNRGIVRNCSIGEMKVESNDSSSKNMKWTLESWGVVDVEGTADVVV